MVRVSQIISGDFSRRFAGLVDYVDEDTAVCSIFY